MKYPLLLFIILNSFVIDAQKNTNDLSINIISATNQYRELFLTKNFQTLSDFASPKLIEYLNTKQDLVYLMTELDKNIELKEAKISSLIYGQNSETIRYNKELQCSIPFTLEIEDSKKKVFIYSGLALVSFDEGKTWFFTFKIDKDNVINNQILGLNENIIIQERSQKIINK